MADSALAEGQSEHRARLQSTVRRTPDDCNASAVHEYSQLRISRFAQTKYPLTGAHSALAAMPSTSRKLPQRSLRHGLLRMPPVGGCSSGLARSFERAMPTESFKRGARAQ